MKEELGGGVEEGEGEGSREGGDVGAAGALEGAGEEGQEPEGGALAERGPAEHRSERAPSRVGVEEWRAECRRMWGGQVPRVFVCVVGGGPCGGVTEQQQQRQRQQQQMQVGTDVGGSPGVGTGTGSGSGRVGSDAAGGGGAEAGLAGSACGPRSVRERESGGEEGEGKAEGWPMPAAEWRVIEDEEVRGMEEW